MSQHSGVVPLHVPHRDAVTAAQIDNLLRVAGTMMSVLLSPMRGSENIPGESDPPREVRTSAETTFIHVCNLLDDLIQDKERWSLETQKGLEKKIEEVHKMNSEFLLAQTRASEELTSPHFRYRPSLARLPDLNWIAILGDLSGAPENTISGIGRTPNEALEAFDAVFAGRIPSHMMAWLEAHERALNAGVVSPPIPTIKNENNPVDQRANRSTQKTNIRRKVRTRNSGGTEPLTGLS